MLPSSRGSSFVDIILYSIIFCFNLHLIDRRKSPSRHSQGTNKSISSVKSLLGLCSCVFYFNFQFETSSALWWHVHGGSTTLGLFFAASVTTTEAIKREPQREVAGAIAPPTPTDRSTSYPGGGASNTITAAASPYFRPARSSNHHDNRENEQNGRGYARDLDICTTVAVSACGA